MDVPSDNTDNNIVDIIPANIKSADNTPVDNTPVDSTIVTFTSKPIANSNVDEDPIISLNVGGKQFMTKKSTLIKMPFFESILSLYSVDTPIPFIDRDPIGFENVLGLMRDSNYHFDHRYLYELDYYGIDQQFNGNVDDCKRLPSKSSINTHSTSGWVSGISGSSSIRYEIPFVTFISCPILLGLGLDLIYAVRIYLGNECIEVIPAKVVEIFNNIYYATRGSDNNCIRLPIFHHTPEEFARDYHKPLSTLSIILDFCYNSPPDNIPKLFYDFRPECSRSLVEVITHEHLLAKVTSEIWFNRVIHSKVSEIWLALPSPLINIIIYADNYELAFTHSVAVEKANGMGLFPANYNYIFRGLPDVKIVDLKMCVTTRAIPGEYANVVICSIDQIHYVKSQWSLEKMI